MYKTCIVCGSEFIPNKYTPNHQKTCSEKCGYEHLKRIMRSKPARPRTDQRKEYDRQWRKRNRSKCAAYCKKWLENNREKAAISLRRYTLKKLFGISLEDYERMLVEQNGVCALCFGNQKGKKHFAVDHNHKTEQVRKLLCVKCNGWLAIVENNPEWLERALEYLRTNG